MSRYLRISLLFLFLGALLGVLLRLHVIYPLPHFKYTNVLHAHSHIMFLGWVFNALYVAYTILHIPTDQQRFFKQLFWILQLLNIGMLISFPLQGYGVYSIAFSTVHTFCTFVFIIQYLKVTRDVKTDATKIARVSLLACGVSAAGPFALAFIMANQLQHSHWYNYAIFYYLHFQYNGFFFFGVMGLFASLFENRNEIDLRPLRKVALMFLIALLPTYFLSILYSNPGVFFNIIGFTGAAMQVVAFIILTKWFRQHSNVLRGFFGSVYPVMLLIIVLLGLKCALQLLSGLPTVARMAYELRPVLIAYLHLVLIGIVTLSVLLWLQMQGYFSKRFQMALYVLLFSFFVMEVTLVAIPWWPAILNSIPAVFLLLITGIGLALASFLLLITFRKTDISQLPG